MSGIDIMTVDPSRLIDFKDIKINEDLPKNKREVIRIFTGTANEL